MPEQFTKEVRERLPIMSTDFRESGILTQRIDADAIDAALHHIDALEARVAVLAAALRQLHDNVDEYQRINSLGGHDNHDMVQARAALADAAGALDGPEGGSRG